MSDVERLAKAMMPDGFCYEAPVCYADGTMNMAPTVNSIVRMCARKAIELGCPVPEDPVRQKLISILQQNPLFQDTADEILRIYELREREPKS